MNDGELHRSTPRFLENHWCWPISAPGVEVVFVGRGTSTTRQQALKAVAGHRFGDLAWLEQVHSSRVVSARSGWSGEADALVTSGGELTLSIATADCLPIVISGPRSLVTVHAGWRGLVAGVIRRSIESLDEDPAHLRCWIGPAIGACCYEVGLEVSRQFAKPGGPEVIIETPGNRPHLDLAAAARAQLAELGLEHVEQIGICTRCSPEWLWSYRLDGCNAGRNWTFAWRKVESGRSDAPN